MHKQKKNETSLYYAAKLNDDNLFESLLTHETMKKETLEETFKLLQNDGGAGLRSIKIAKIVMGKTLGEKVEKETEYFLKTDTISNHFIKTLKNQENENIFKSIIKSITKSIIKIIKEFKPISNDLLIIIFNLKDENSQELWNEIISIMNEICNPNKFDLLKWCWFDEYLSNSSIWLIKNEKNELLYSQIEKIVEKYDKNNLSEIMKKDILESKIIDEKEEWSLITNKNINELNNKYLDPNLKNNNNNNINFNIRQDNIELFQIILNDKNKNEIENKLIKIDENLLKLSLKSKNNKIINVKNKNNKNIEKFYNNQIYLSQILFQSEIINDEVMFEIKEMIFSLFTSKEKVIEDFIPAPIKKLERCIEKTEIDYMNEKFPQSSRLLDIIRCSMYFKNLKNLFITLNHIYQHINQNKNNNNCLFKGIIKIKNGFIEKDENGDYFDFNHPTYKDIKLNILIEIHDILTIIEMQFILTPFYKSKKISHNLYNISRIKQNIQYSNSFIQFQPSIDSILLNSSITSCFFVFINYFISHYILFLYR